MNASRLGFRYLALLTLAYGAGVISYVPLLTLLLPMKVEAVAGLDKVAVLSLATLAGAAVAGPANILAGHLSDVSVRRGAGRRRWVIAGLVAVLASYALLLGCRTPASVVLGVVLFQVAVNLMLAPLMALVADEAPDEQKGLVGGLFGAVYPLGSVAGVLVTAWPEMTETVRMAIVGGLVIVGLTPFLALTRAPAVLNLTAPSPVQRAVGARNLTLVWLARLLVQVAGAILFCFSLFYFETVRGAASEPKLLAASVAWLSGAAAVVTVPVAVVVGRWSDLAGTRKPFLAASAGLVTVGLLVMAMLPEWSPASVGFILFACGSAVFLSLQSTYAMQLLPSGEHRGRDLGVLNLTNTIPSMVAAVLAYAVARVGDFSALLLLLAVFTAAGGGLMLLVRDRASDAAGLAER